MPLSMTDVTVLKFDLASSSFEGAGFFISLLFAGQTLMVRYILGSSLLVAVVLVVGCSKSYEPKAEDIPNIPPSTRSAPGGGGGPATAKKGGNAVAPPKK